MTFRAFECKCFVREDFLDTTNTSLNLRSMTVTDLLYFGEVGLAYFEVVLDVAVAQLFLAVKEVGADCLHLLIGSVQLLQVRVARVLLDHYGDFFFKLEINFTVFESVGFLDESRQQLARLTNAMIYSIELLPIVKNEAEVDILVSVIVVRVLVELG